MRWYLLRDRRHEGPYTKEQVAESVKAGRIDPRDYLLPEKAVEDQSSFAYISASDVLGPEFIYDLKKAEALKPQGSAPSSFSVQGEEPSPASGPSKTQLISEFEEGLESTQLFNLKKERSLSESPSSPQMRLESFTSQPASGFKFPWAIAGIVIIVLGVAAYFAQPLIEKSPAPLVKTAATPAPAAAARNFKQNRVPTGRVQLPTTGIRDEEPSSALSGTRSEERAEPTRKRRKRKAVSNESTEAVEDADAASDAESFDEEEYVEEDESSEEDVDEADI